VATRVTSTRLVGRSAELADLRGLLDEAAAGRPGIVFVGGESGVGKTRLLTELERASEESVQVLHGECLELGEGELPYAPLVGALRPLAREHDPVLAALPEGARAELATLLPELQAPGPPAGDQGRLFEALLGLLDRLGRREPVLLALEDIHWADRSTSAFLTFLGRALAEERVLVVATYRTDELHRRHPLRPLLAQLERAPRARRIELAPLSRDELAQALEDISGRPPEPGLIDRLYARSEGNPLFAEELLAAGADGRGALPATLRDALMLRVERLSADAQDVLRLLATAGRADHGLLADAGALDARALREAVRETVAGHIVVVGSGDRYEFRHALLREVVHDDLLPGERAELHLALAHALEQRAAASGDGAWVSAAIAHHFHEAGDQPAALQAAIVAGGEAERVRAAGEAAAQYGRALELWPRVADAERHAGVDHVEVLVRAGRARFMQGDDARSLPLLEAASDEVDAAADPRRAAAVLGELARVQWGLGRGEASRSTLNDALALLGGDGESSVRATLLAEQVRILMLQGRHRETLEASVEALRMAEAAGDEAVRGNLLNRRGSVLIALGEHDAGMAALREAIAVARRTGRADHLSMGYVNLADALHQAGRSAEAHAICCEGLREVTGDDRSARWVVVEAAEIEIDRGDWASASERLTPQHFRAGHGLVNEQLRVAQLAAGRGEDEVARTLLEECERWLVNSLEPPFIAATGILRAELDRRAGDLAAARAAVEDALDRIEYCSEDLARLSAVSAAGVAVEADAAERARDLHDADAERTALAAAAMMLDRVRATVEDGRPVEAAHLLTAEAEGDRAAGEPAAERWATAAEAWDALERPYPAAEARWREAEAHVVAGRREAAERALAAAIATADRLGAAWLAGEAQGLAARARLQVSNGEQPTAAEPPDGLEPFGLTPRERQVLELLAGGATNRQIGQTLFMAEKTASVHVSRILSKLDVRSRTEAAAVAHRQGLT
jgi:DNA-binding CsgD family transcriptional regulator/tetratricopeptide (TPR) repeat protein